MTLAIQDGLTLPGLDPEATYTVRPLPPGDAVAEPPARTDHLQHDEVGPEAVRLLGRLAGAGAGRPVAALVEGVDERRPRRDVVVLDGDRDELLPLQASEVVRAALRVLDREEREYEAKLLALRAAIDEGDASGVAKGNVFARVRKTLNLPAENG